MANQLYDQYGPNSYQHKTVAPNNDKPVPPNQDMMKSWNNFKNTFQGDPETIGKQMVQNGIIPQPVFQKLSALANFYKMFLH